jgi:tRNA(fMet)-specific endonuclease VapC
MNLTHLLDTGWIVRSLRGTRAYDQTILKVGAAQLALSIISVAELFEGVYRAADRTAAERSLHLFVADTTILSITHDICRLFGEHRAGPGHANQLIRSAALLIAATCLSKRLTPRTTNLGHFERVLDPRITFRLLP